MSDVWERLKSVMMEEFLEPDDLMIVTETTKLAEISNWDSMAAVNLQILIHETFCVELPLDLLRDEATFSDLIGFISFPETIADAMRKVNIRN
ncbi:MAG: acyl carrier protein [Syntrophales bacterium]|jgi:acyl carrier protein|nr:acyl carrier protein [Syntrophales bacterium]